MLNFSCLTARCVLLCKWASLREAELQAGGAAWEFINSCLGDECAPNRALLVTQQLVPCKMTFSFFQLFSSNYFPLKSLFSGLGAFLWMLFSSCPHCIFYMTVSSKNWCNEFVHSAVPKFSSICGRSSKGQMHLRSIVTVAWNGNCNAWKISCWFIFISADENYYDVSSRV